MSGEGETPRIIVDDDWKSQAQAEREKLAEAEAQAGGETGAGGGSEVPEASLSALTRMLATQALVYMGGVADPQSGKAIFDPEYSKHMIDLLGVLEVKTSGNLTDEESRELSGIVGDLRSRWVELVQMVAAQGGAGGPMGGGPGGPAVGGSGGVAGGPSGGPAGGPSGGMGPIVSG